MQTRWERVWLETELGFGDTGQTVPHPQAWEYLPAQGALECAVIQELNVKQRDFLTIKVKSHKVDPGSPSCPMPRGSSGPFLQNPPFEGCAGGTTTFMQVPSGGAKSGTIAHPGSIPRPLQERADLRCGEVGHGEHCRLHPREGFALLGSPGELRGLQNPSLQ